MLHTPGTATERRVHDLRGRPTVGRSRRPHRRLAARVGRSDARDQPLGPLPLAASPLQLALGALRELATELRRNGHGLRGVFGEHRPTTVDTSLSVAQAPPSRVLVARFALPVTRNDGRLVRVEELQSFFASLFDRTGGASIYPMVGLCRDGSVAEVDVLLDIEVWATDLDPVESLARAWAERLGQRDLWLRVSGPVELRSLRGWTDVVQSGVARQGAPSGWPDAPADASAAEVRGSRAVGGAAVS